MAHQELPPAAGAAGPPLPPEVVAGPPRTYRELYSDAANNPAFDRVAGYLAGYRFAGEGDIPTPAQLRDQTVALSDRQPMAFLCLVNGPDGNPDVSVVHRLLRFVDSPGDEPTGFNDRVLGLLGDIMPHQYPAVDIPNTTYHLVGAPVRVPTVAAMEALIPTWADSRVPLGPFTEEDPETEVIRPRNTQLIPGKYASLIIHRRRVKAKQAYQEVVGAIRADEALERCGDVVTWLRAACTARGGGGALQDVPGVLLQLNPVHLPPEVYQYVTSKVQGDLPGIVATAGGGVSSASAATLVGALRALTRREGEDGMLLPRESKSITDVYKETHRVLLRFCNVSSADDVAPVWQRLANCHKSEQHTLLTQELQKVCVARGLSTQLYVPVVTTALKQMVVGFQFAGYSVDDLSTGCQPFMVAYAGKAHHHQVTSASAVAAQLAQGDQSASLADIRTIREGEKLKFPLNATEVCITLYRYAVLCQMLFQGAGERHPFVESLWKVASGLKDVEPFVTDKYNELASVHRITSIYYARIVRAVQVLSQEYLMRVATNGEDNIEGVAVPSFDNMLLDLTRGTFQNSTNWIDLPMEYMEPGTTSRAHPYSVATTASTGPSTRSVQSAAVSTLTGDTAPANVRITNPAPDSEFASITLRPGGTRPIMRDHPPPASDDGRELCVAWWTRGACYSNCGRRETHRPFASQGERTRLLAYVQERLAAPPAARGGNA